MLKTIPPRNALTPPGANRQNTRRYHSMAGSRGVLVSARGLVPTVEDQIGGNGQSGRRGAVHQSGLIEEQVTRWEGRPSIGVKSVGLTRRRRSCFVLPVGMPPETNRRPKPPNVISVAGPCMGDPRVVLNLAALYRCRHGRTSASIILECAGNAAASGSVSASDLERSGAPQTSQVHR